MRKILSFGLVLAISAAGLPVAAAPAAKGAAPRVPEARGGISGAAKDVKGQNLSNVKVRVRNPNTGSVMAEVQTNASGAFSAPGLTPGTYVVEGVKAAGEVVGLSPAIAVAAGTTATVTVTATALGALVGAGAAAGGLSLLGLGTAGP